MGLLHFEYIPKNNLLSVEKSKTAKRNYRPQRFVCSVLFGLSLPR